MAKPSFFVRFGRVFSRLLSFYVGLQGVIWFLILVALFRRPILDRVVAPTASLLSTSFNDGTLGNAILLSVISGIVSAVVLGALGAVIFSRMWRARFAGNYDAFVLTGENDSQKTPWGKAKILYHPFAIDRNGVPVTLHLEYEDSHERVRLEGKGLIVGRTLVGHYTDVGNPERRRSGSFFYELSGDGQSWQGEFLYVDPNTSKATIAKGRWERHV